MATFNRFEDIEAWQRARELTREIYGVSHTGLFARDMDLRGQTRRASVSIMSNIAEGFERGGTKEFIHFLSISKGSAGEVKSLLYVALDQNYVRQDVFDKLYQKASEISNMIGGLMNYLQKSQFKGRKFK